MSRILAFDPATQSASWALLEISGRALHFVVAGEVGIIAAADSLAQLFVRVEPDVVAVECPAKTIFDRARAPMVMRSTRASGWIEGVAMSRGFPTIAVSANTWRTLLIGKHNAEDERIALAVRSRVVGLPARTSNHVRDAAGLAAVVASHLASGRSLAELQRQVEYAESTKSEKVKAMVKRGKGRAA